MPDAEVAIDASLALALVREQHDDLASLPLIEASEGWDNKPFRLGDELVVRFPRRHASAALIAKEQRWLPLLALPHCSSGRRHLPLRYGRGHRSGFTATCIRPTW